ncbi:MAG: C39 family peptidase [Ruminococcus sp.]|nr:C39 family peptidase [Ruminococcus sp.]
MKKTIPCILTALSAAAVMLSVPASAFEGSFEETAPVIAEGYDATAAVTAPQFKGYRSGLYTITPKWKTVKDADGYEISIKKDGEWYKKYTKKTAYAFGMLQSHTSYKFRIRAYKKVDGRKRFSKYTNINYWTASKVKCTSYTAIYKSPTYSAKTIGSVYAGSVMLQCGDPSNGWMTVYTNAEKTKIGYVPESCFAYYVNLKLIPINQNSYAGGKIAPLGCEETSLASVLKNQYKFKVTKNQLIDKYMPKKSFYWNGRRYVIDVDPNYCFWGSPYHSSEPDGNGYGVYAPVIAQIAYKYLKAKGKLDDYNIELHTDYYTGNNPNKLKFDPTMLKLGDTKITEGLSKRGIMDELEKGHNVIVWYNVASSPYVSSTQTLKKGGKYTKPGKGSYTFKWYAHQHTAVITGYDDATDQFIIANVWNNNSSSGTGVYTYIKYDHFMSGYTTLGRQSVVVYRKN